MEEGFKCWEEAAGYLKACNMNLDAMKEGAVTAACAAPVFGLAGAAQAGNDLLIANHL